MTGALCALVAALALVIGGCSSTGSDATTTTRPPGDTNPSTSSTTVTAPTTSTTATSTTAPSTTTPGSTTTPPTTSTTTTAAPATPVHGPVPESSWSVVGVRHDDVLNIRVDPGPTSPIVATLEPTGDGVVATGVAVQVGSTVWWEVDVGSTSGWVAATYLGAFGSTGDVTSDVIARADGVRPEADTMDELAALVVSLRPGGESVVVAPASPGTPIGDITVDVFEPGDDAIRGERLVVFGQRLDDDSPFSLYSVESTSICWRAADAAGLCV